jgi:hypothetical protein
MFRVDDIWDDGKKILGACDDDTFFRRLGDAVSLIVNKGEFEGWKGWLDICTTNSGRCITMPREVETVLSLNIGGRPALGFGQLFNFHLNGVGDCRCSCDWAWQDQGVFHSTYRDITQPAKLVAFTQTEADNGKELIVFGYDSAGNKLRRQVGAEWRDGYQVPTIYGLAVSDEGAPTIARITGIFKARTVGSIRLSTIDDSGDTGVTLGIYEPDETLPQYRRIKLIGRTCSWVRVAYRKATPVFGSRYDHVPLRSRHAMLMAMAAVKFYKEFKFAEAHACEADAARMEIEAQNVVEPTTTLMPMQVVDGTQSLRDKTDYDIR